MCFSNKRLRIQRGTMQDSGQQYTRSARLSSRPDHERLQLHGTVFDL